MLPAYPSFSDDESFQALLKSLQIPLEEAAETESRVRVEFKRIWPRLLRGLVITTRPSEVQKSAKRIFRMEGVPQEDASDLAAVVMLKIWTSFFGGLPRGSVVALIERICENVLADYGRKKKREDRMWGDRREPTYPEEWPARPDEWLEFNLMISELPPESQAIALRLRRGEKIGEILQALNISMEQFSAIAQSFGRPAESPRGKNRRRKRRS